MSETTMTPAEVEAKLLRGPFHQWLGLKVPEVGDRHHHHHRHMAPPNGW